MSENQLKSWVRKSPLDLKYGDSSRTEVWERHSNGEVELSYEVDVTIGKPIDILLLKGQGLPAIHKYADFVEESVEKMYRGSVARQVISNCPICNAPANTAVEVCQVYQVGYKQCENCTHVFVGEQPGSNVSESSFTETEEHSSTYIDKDSLEARMAQVVTPKLEWVLEQYAKHYKTKPESIADIGAGGGHFVEVVNRAGIVGHGYELSKASQKFASEVFGIELCPRDWLEEDLDTLNFDVITFWGLLEYIQEPGRFLQTANKILSKTNGLLILELTRFNSISSAIQMEDGSAVARHMAPATHVNIFTDSSISTMLHENGFKPIGAWYFGMDIYELLVQLGFLIGDDDILEKCAKIIPGVQKHLDASNLSDEVIIAAVPIK